MKYNKEQIEAAQITVDEFINHWGKAKTLKYILSSKKYTPLFLKFYFKRVYNLI